MEKVNILIADDDKIFSELTRFVLEENGFNVFQSFDLEKTISFISLKQIDIVILDLHFPRYEDGITALKEIKEKFNEIPVIMVTSEYIDVIGKAVEAIKCGAYDFVEKPIKEERLVLTIKNALEVAELKSSIAMKPKKAVDLIGTSEQMNTIFNQIQEFAKNDEAILITGEAGSGKKVIAKAIHNLSSRNSKDTYFLNCASIHKEQFDQELYGIRSDIPNRLVNEYHGKLELASNSTLIIDNITMMPTAVQKKLLSYLLSTNVVLKENSRLENNARIIVISSSDISQAKNMDSDFVNYLSKNIISVPPLRERRDDIRPLIDFYSDVINNTNHTNYIFSEEVIKSFEQNEWKGNIRELQSKIAYLLINSPNELIKLEDIQFTFNMNDDLLKLTYKNAMKALEKEYLLTLLNHHNWNVANAAKAIGIDRTNLFKKMKNHDIKPIQKSSK
jgi:DNA-binding NtrC family response regulator